VLCLVPALLLSACATPIEEPSFVFYPEPPEVPRIQFLGTYSSDLDVQGPVSFFERFILGARESRELAKPYGVAIHDGKILVCDSKAGVVVVFDLVGQAVSWLGGDRTGRLQKPINIAVDEDGTRFVTDMGRRRVMVYDQTNRYVRALGDPEAWSPTDVVIVGKRLYLTDLKNGQVVVLDKESGEELRRFGRRGSGEGEMFFPTNIEADADGNLFVADTGNFRLLKFDAKGKQLQQFGQIGIRHGQFVRPKGIAVDHEGRVYVVDAAFETVQIFDRDGKLLLFFGSAGNHPGGINLPAKVEIDYENVDLFTDRVAPGYEIEYVILVTSQFGRNKVNAYGFLKPGKGEVTQQ
jgi:DNA-binding beta-propeller fold protein YncE